MSERDTDLDPGLVAAFGEGAREVVGIVDESPAAEGLDLEYSQPAGRRVVHGLPVCRRAGRRR